MLLNWNTAFGRVLASSVAVLAATTSLYAIPKGPCDPRPADVCCEEPKPGPFAFSFPMDRNITCPRDFYVNADFLAFQAKQDGMEFVIQDANGVGATLSNGTVEGFSNDHSDWEYNFGARVGMGFYLDHDAWNVDFNWTWLNISDYKHANATTGGGTLIPLWLVGIDTPAAEFGQRSSAVWDASYNTLDASLGKPYHISRYVVFNPHFGVRAGWIDQHFSVDYSGNATLGTTNRVVAHGNNDFWGFGARAGLDSTWMLGKGWSLFGNCSGSLLWGKFEVEQHMQLPNGSSVNVDIQDNHFMNVPNCDIALGISWGSFFSKMKYYVDLKAGYEFHVWFDQLNMRRFWSATSGAAGGAYANDVVSRGNLTMNGFSLRLQLDM